MTTARREATGFPVQAQDLRPGWVFTTKQVAWTQARGARIVLSSDGEDPLCQRIAVDQQGVASTAGDAPATFPHQTVFLQAIVGSDDRPLSAARLSILARRLGPQPDWRLCDWVYALGLGAVGRTPAETRSQLKLVRSGSVSDNGWAMGMYAGPGTMTFKRRLWEALSSGNWGLEVEWVSAPPVWEKACQIVTTPVGLGVQARKHIAQDEIVGAYSGRWLSEAPLDADALFTLTAEPFQVDGRLTRSMGCLLNGSCARGNVCISVYAVEGADPEVPAVFGLAVSALTPIRAGSAVFMDYGRDYFDAAGFPCNGMHCGPECTFAPRE